MGRHNPHDALVKALFGDPRVSADIVRRLLPAAVIERLDWSTFEAVPTEFIGADLTDRRADLVFKARVAGHPTFIFVLLEHQSSPDVLMPFRALVYMVRLWESWLRDNPGARRLPAIAPLVIYHGEHPWTAPRRLRRCLDLPPALDAALGRFLPDLRLLLDDLSLTSDDEIEASTRASLATAGLLMLKNGPHLGEAAHLDRLVEHLVAAGQAPEAVHALVQAVCYIYEVCELEAGTVERRIVGRLPPDATEAVMTTAERLRAEGEARGRALGEARGRALGEQRGHARSLQHLLELKFGALDDETRRRLDSADVDALIRWTGRVLSAESLADVFA